MSVRVSLEKSASKGYDEMLEACRNSVNCLVDGGGLGELTEGSVPKIE